MSVQIYSMSFVTPTEGLSAKQLIILLSIGLKPQIEFCEYKELEINNIHNNNFFISLN